MDNTNNTKPMTKRFKLGDLVYCKTDRQQVMRMITGILERGHGYLYYASEGGNEVGFNDFELSTEPDVLLKMNG